MENMEINGLQSTRDFLVASLTNITTSAIKRLPIKEINRREIAFELYGLLNIISRRSQIFVISLELYIQYADLKLQNGSCNSVHDKIYDEIYFPAGGGTYADKYTEELHNLSDSVRALKKDLISLNKIFHIIYPNLDIYRHNLAEEIIIFQYSRSGLLHYLNVNLNKIEDLKISVAKAKENQLQIQEVVNQYRNLLAQEFSFKESFLEVNSIIVEKITMESKDNWNISNIYKNNNIHGDNNNAVQGDNIEAVIGNGNLVNQTTDGNMDRIENLTQADILQLLNQLESLIKETELPAETKAEVLEDLSAAKTATDREQPNKKRALDRLTSVAEALEKTSKSLDAGQKIWQYAKPTLIKVATALGAVAGSHFFGL